LARLHEYQSKALLQAAKIKVPEGAVATTPDMAAEIAQELGGPVVVKAQAWITGRAEHGAIKFAQNPEDARHAAEKILGMKLNQFTVDKVLVEEQLDIEREFYAGVIIDDAAQAPTLIFSSEGGSGIEEIARDHPQTVVQQTIDILQGLPEYQARDWIRRLGIQGKLQLALGGLLSTLYQVARSAEARAAEVNPIVLTKSGDLIAADCRITIDDNAVYRHPELSIEVAREFDRPPTELERIAWNVEKNDYRGTFYFIELETEFSEGDGVIGFHGAGGGGSMMSMDAILNLGLRLANFVDTSGNPPASKVYRAARIVLAQGGIDGYFASGSGVASQEQFHSARGLVKAFMEVPLTVPAVIRLGGNAEQRAIAILERAVGAIPAPIEGYGKDHTPEFCASRMKELIDSFDPTSHDFNPVTRPLPSEPYSFPTVTGGTVTFDHALCSSCESKICISSCVPGILELDGECPVLNISEQDAQTGGCTECLACEVECYFEGNAGGWVDLPIPGLQEYLEKRK
jgi:succinyl-CoA synthetase beta subunit